MARVFKELLFKRNRLMAYVIVLFEKQRLLGDLKRKLLIGINS
jgi:hypothetical protein